MGTPPSFPPCFQRETLFCSSGGRSIFPKWGLLLKEKIAPMGANSFLYKMTQVILIWETTMKMTELLPLKVSSFILRCMCIPHFQKALTTSQLHNCFPGIRSPSKIGFTRTVIISLPWDFFP